MWNDIRNIMGDGAGALKKIVEDENFRTKLTEYINAGDKAALVGALNSAAYQDE